MNLDLTKVRLIELQENCWLLIQMIQDWGFHNPTLGIGS